MIDRILEKFSKARIAVVGDLILDRYQYADVERISPEAPVPVIKLRNGQEDIRAGGAANVALNLVSLGANVQIYGVVGHDNWGEKLVRILNAAGIDTTGVMVDKNRPTTCKNRIISRNQQVIRIDLEEDSPISEEFEVKIKGLLKENLNSLDAIIVEDYNKGVLTPGLIRFISKRLSKKTTVGVDPKFENFGLYKDVTLFKPNRRELLRYTGKPDKELIIAIKETFTKLHPEYLLVTLSEKGMIIYDGDQFYKIPAIKKDVYDVTGAGDTVIAVTILGLVSGLSMQESAILSTIAAGIEVSKFGVASVTPDELRYEFARYFDTLKTQMEISV